MDAHQIDIIALAWSRELGLPDSGLAGPGTRHVRVDQTADRVRFLRLAGASALVGPQWAIERAEGYSDDELSGGAAMLAITKDHGGTCSGPRLLSFAADVGTEIGREDPLISHDLEHVLALQSACPPDDVAEADLTDRRNWFTLVDDAGTPLSSSGYSEWQGILAQMAVLTAPEHRRRGHGAVVARLTTNDAIDGGLIPQWRSHPGNTASRRLAASLGYEELGIHTVAALTGSSV
ncbi:GNAT family N-acetyltransferase [Rhodococcus sp. NPDC058514]|uniref:GNAT family N-acetyltransferase n=1 Tax=unclassified Rhodococcus (in: high G+C Gram-positive bacteria) TaxID=192944 RepID=UPI003649C674